MRLAFAGPSASRFCLAGFLVTPFSSDFTFSAHGDWLIDRREQLGVVIDRLERCGPGAERATYNMGVNRLCLSQGLHDQPEGFSCMF